MAQVQNPFTEHPHTVGETYAEHMHSATYFGSRMIGAGFCCLVHGIFPFLFTKTGSKTVTHLHTVMVQSRVRTAVHGTFTEIGAHI